jgi:predicted AlkP superfamily phosphohydrolase/phosphomutase
MVAGFVAIELAKAVYPLSHLAALEKMGYQTDIDTQKARQDHAFLWRELSSTLEGGRKAFLYFCNQEWDLFEFVVTGTDRLHHYLWDAHADARHPCHAGFCDYYMKVDSLIDQIVSKFEELSGGIEGLYLLSDHGFTGIVQEVYLNAWLEKAGFLRFDSPGPKRLVDIAPGTRAFALDPNRIYINLKSRFPRGVVAMPEREILKSEISAALKELEFGGRKVVREVFDTEEIYSGPYVAEAPDLVVLAERGFDLKGSLEKKDIFDRSDLQGMHTWDDAFLWASKNCGSDLTISDVSARIMEEFE